MLLLKLAYRNLWRNRRRTLLTMSAMSIATMLVILMLGIYDGMLWDMIEGATDLYHGHVKITAEGYMNKPQIHVTLEENNLRETILADPRITGVAGRVRGFALLSFSGASASHTQPAELFGIDPEEERTVTRLESHVLEGSFISGSDTKEILLGRGLAKRLDAVVGGEIVAMGQGADGSIAAEIFHVAGIIDTADRIRDASLAIVGRTTLQKMMVLDGRVHEWAISLSRPLEAKMVAEDLLAKLSGVEVTPWHGFLPLMSEILDMWNAMKFIFAMIFYFAVMLVAINTMYMAFFERLREFGIMGAVGMKISRLSFMIILEGFLMSGISGLVGGTIGILISVYMNTHFIDLSRFFTDITYAGTSLQPRLRCYLMLSNMIVPIIMITLLGMIIACFPSLRLRRLRPVDVLREV